jgi:hypothetical protein
LHIRQAVSDHLLGCRKRITSVKRSRFVVILNPVQKPRRVTSVTLSGVGTCGRVDEESQGVMPQSLVWKSCNGRTYKKEGEKIYVQKSDGEWDLVAVGFSPAEFEKHLKTKWQIPGTTNS